MTQTLTRPIAWLGLRLCVPDAWQVVRHSVTPHKGSLVLVDRRRQRLQLLWTDVPRQPDIAHMVRDHEARERVADADAQFTPFEAVAGWSGIVRELDGGAVITRVVQWDAPTGRLLEAVLLTDPADPADVGVVESVLGSVQVVCRGEQETRFALFDLDVQTLEGWRLERARVRPADVTFRFAEYGPGDRPTRNQAWVRRRGMADAWYGNDNARLLRRDISGARPTLSETAYKDQPATRAISREPGKRYQRLLGRLRVRRDVVWHWLPGNAVYQITTLSGSRRPVEPEALDVDYTADRGASRELEPDPGTIA